MAKIEKKVIEAAKKRKDSLRKDLAGILFGNYKQIKNKDLFLIDIANFIQYYSAVIKKNYKNAYVLQWDMDTFPREYIPNFIFNFVTMKAEQEDIKK